MKLVGAGAVGFGGGGVGRVVRILFWILITSRHQVVFVSAGFGDTVSSPQDADPVCPVTTTCPVICVADLKDCPTTGCPSDMTLCPDGHCSSDCGAGKFPHTTVVCPNDCAPLACPKTVDNVYETCLADFADFYAAAEQCAEQTRAENLRTEITMGPTAVGFLMTWIVAVSVCLLLYCQYKRLATTTIRHEMEEGQFQAGYKHHIVGTLMFYWTVVTVWAFQVVFLALVIVYYANQNSDSGYQSMWYEDEERLLLDFEVTWLVGFFWCFLMKWPPSLRAVFWHPCPLEDATVVAVWTKHNRKETVQSQYSIVSAVRNCLGSIAVICNSIVGAFFAVDSSHSDGTWTYCPVQKQPDPMKPTDNKYFVHNFRRYNLEQDQFVPSGWSLQQAADHKIGLTHDEVGIRRRVCGPNIIPMVKPTLTKVIVDEFTQPYYTYQNFIMWSWVPIWYYYMAMVQSSVIIFGGVMVALFKLRNEESLYKLTHVEGHVQVVRGGQYETISPADLVPGDIIMVEPGMSYCDAVLVASAGVLVDESALTGEANPIAKTAMEDPKANIGALDPVAGKRNTISAGCTILESEHGHNFAVVTHTGSYTTKGELLRNIFSYQRHPFKFDTEVSVVLLILVVYGFIGFFFVFWSLSYSPVYGWFYGVYALSSIMPPLLPTVFTVSVGVSDKRLADHRIACTNSEEILVAGKVRRAFFDKTGTLTKQGLEFISVYCGKSWTNQDAVGTDHISAEMALCIATCHSLTKSNSGDYIGNPVDCTMFSVIGADILPVSSDDNTTTVKERNGNRAEVVRHFDFDHHRMTQSVIVKSQGKLYAFVKGSGESMVRLCRPESLPSDFNESLRASAKAGIYQITMATRELDAGLSPTQIQELTRDAIEQSLAFLGVINFKNVIREETPSVIHELENGDVRCVMITGDSVLTGIRIAKESGIIGRNSQVLCATEMDPQGRYPIWLDEEDNLVPLPGSLSASNIELAISGVIWESMCKTQPETANEWAEHIRVFGRCTPLEKVAVVTHFVDRGFITLMCGDGGNDCGALKTAHVGVALSDAEASIVAPFTSLDKTITSVPEVLKEGRCALASALASYKFMIMYGQLVFSTDVTNSVFHIYLSKWCWVFIDGLWSIGLAMTLPLTAPSGQLTPSRPTSSLLGSQTMFSACGVLAIHYIFYFITIGVLFSQDWFECRRWEGFDITNTLTIGDNYETETMFLVVGYQLISSAITFNFGYEWRESWFKNTRFVVFVTLISLLHLYVLLEPGYASCLFRVNCGNEHVVRSVTDFNLVPIQNHWNTTVMPTSYRYTLLVIIIANTLSVIIWDYVVVNGTRIRVSKKRLSAGYAHKAMAELTFAGGEGPV